MCYYIVEDNKRGHLPNSTVYKTVLARGLYEGTMYPKNAEIYAQKTVKFGGLFQREVTSQDTTEAGAGAALKAATGAGTVNGRILS